LTGSLLSRFTPWGFFTPVLHNPTEGSQAAGSQGIEFDLDMMVTFGALAQQRWLKEEQKKWKKVF